MSARLDRFWQKVDRDSETCWNWTGCLSTNGYGRFWADGRVNNAHRWLMAELGHDVTGMDIDHLCQNKRCVNPAHLEVVTRAENTRRSPYSRSRRDRQVCNRGHDAYRPRGDGYRWCADCSRTLARRAAAKRKATV